MFFCCLATRQPLHSGLSPRQWKPFLKAPPGHFFQAPWVCGNSEVGREVSDDRDRTAGTREDRRFAEDVAESFRSHTNSRMIGVHHEPRTSAEYTNFASDAAG